MNNVGIYECSKYKAYIYPKKIVFCTKLQAFRIVPLNRHHKTCLEMLKKEVTSGDIRTIADIPCFEGRLVWEHCTVRPM